MARIRSEPQISFTTPEGDWRNNHGYFFHRQGPGGCHLYRFWDASGRLLYVGISVTPAERWAKHRQKKSWWPDVATIGYTAYRSEYEALCAEVRAIRTELPVYNIRSAVTA